jgi:MoaA/NifB/PqqE/SkfB family radical SAM enzyme
VNLDYNNNFKTLQIELSTLCNALCLGCVRTDTRNFNSAKPFIPKGKYIDPQIIIDLLQSKNGQRIQKLDFCGNIDEPFVYPKLKTLLEQIHDIRPELFVSLHTNGGVAKPKLYREVSELLVNFDRRSNIRFSIDGLEDTNHIYRQNVQWPKVMENLRESIEGGANIIWQFLIFPWNEHQGEEAQALAKEMGCKEFWIRPDRSEASYLGLEKINQRKIKDRNPVAKRSAGQLSNLRNYAKFKGREIVCSFRNEGMLFLSWEAKLWPCCFISNVFYESELKNRIFRQHFLSKYEEGFNDLNKRSFDEIVSSSLFKKDLVQSWKDGGSKDKLAFRCVERCSKARVRASDNKPDDRSHVDHVILK